MPLTEIVPDTLYLCPAEAQQAKQAYLDLLRSPGDTHILAYGFDESDLIDEILKADQAGIAVHLLLDHTQAGGTAEKPEVARLANLVHGDVTIACSPVGGQLLHIKCITVAATDGGEDWYAEGSLNFSPSGLRQVNSFRVCRSNAKATLTRVLFDSIRAAAWSQHRAWQVQPQPPPDLVNVALARMAEQGAPQVVTADASVTAAATTAVQ